LCPSCRHRPDPRLLHKLRHTFATSYLAAGADITYVQAALGHADIKMTMRYARVRKTDLKRTMGRVKY
jgi:site-specific recombinase XerD